MAEFHPREHLIESQNSEFKLVWKDEYLKWICGFANAQGGRLFIGVADNGQILGVKDAPKLLEDIPNKTIAHLGVVVDVHLRTHNKNQYLEVTVPASSVPISYHGAYHYRSGSTKQELRESGRNWDDLPQEAASREYIDEQALRAFLIQSATQHRINHIAPTDSSDIMTSTGHLKNAAVLAFGVEPHAYYPMATFKIGRFGNSNHDLITDLPIESLASKHPSKTHNPLIASLFFKAGLIEAGVPTPQFQTVFGGVQVEFLKVKVGDKVGDHLTENQRTILQLLVADPHLGATKIAAQIGISVRKTEDNLRKLKEKKLLRRKGSPRQGTWEVLSCDSLEQPAK